MIADTQDIPLPISLSPLIVKLLSRCARFARLYQSILSPFLTARHFFSSTTSLPSSSRLDAALLGVKTVQRRKIWTQNANAKLSKHNQSGQIGKTLPASATSGGTHVRGTAMRWTKLARRHATRFKRLEKKWKTTAMLNVHAQRTRKRSPQFEELRWVIRP